MSHERIESLSFPAALTSSDGPSQATPPYPAKRVDSSARVPTAFSANLNDSAPNSQDSHVSSSSKGSTLAQQLTSDSSNVSNVSLPDTAESTSPLSLNGPFSQGLNEAQLEAARRPLTPDIRHGSHTGGSDGTASISVSPSSVDSSHLKQGSKRTASGAVKPSVHGLATGPLYTPQSRNSDSYGRERNPRRISEASSFSTLYMSMY